MRAAYDQLLQGQALQKDSAVSAEVITFTNALPFPVRAPVLSHTLQSSPTVHRHEEHISLANRCLKIMCCCCKISQKCIS